MLMITMKSVVYHSIFLLRIQYVKYFITWSVLNTLRKKYLPNFSNHIFSLYNLEIILFNVYKDG